MCRLAVFADIHGNGPALEAVLADLEQQGMPDAFLVAGDITCGPDQHEVLRRLRDLRAVMILGNADQGLAQYAAGTAPEYVYHARQFKLVRWAFEHLRDDEAEFLQTLPEQRSWQPHGGTAAIRLVHGSPRRIDEPVYPQKQPAVLDGILASVPEPVVVFGHTHLQWQERRDSTPLSSRLALNPGALSFPEDGWIGAQYALLDWNGMRWEPTFHRVRYDMHQLCRAYRESGFLDTGPLARVFLQSILTGVDCLEDFFRHAARLSESAGSADSPYFADAVWELAAETFPWAPLDETVFRQPLP